MVAPGHLEARVLLVAAIASGQGKTTVTAALARKLAAQGQRVRVFKAGLVDQAGTTWPMTGLLPGCVTMQARLAALRGHAFHYSRCDTAHTVKPASGAAGAAVYRSGSLTASYFHACFPACPAASALPGSAGAA
jgi:cobyrinic acid a,c-diamide synthase